MTGRFRSICLAVGAASALGACGSLPSPMQLSASCANLSGQAIASSVMGLPSGAGVVTSATWVEAAATLPAYCKVLGRLAARDARAQAIHFQVNLPVSWNGKALQYGGGGFNGTLVTGLTPLRDASPTDVLPLARGYLTMGTDSGHQASAFAASEPGAFALNDEMLENFAFASYKKVRDVAVHLARTQYGRAPAQVYYAGGSEGGREGLAMAQRFPADYDGVISVVPVINWTGLFHAFVRGSVPQMNDWLDAGKTPLIAKATTDACDALDGLVDGVVNNYLACQPRVNLRSLRCPDGNDAGAHCLSDGELTVMQHLHAPYPFSFPLANGLTQYPAWLYGHEDSLDGPLAMSFVRWVTGRSAPTAPANHATASTHWLYGSNWIRYAVARDAAFDVKTYRPEAFVARVQQTSALMDATNPDLSAFFARGGKLIIRENAADRAQSPLMGIQYHQAMASRVGAATAEASARLYVSPASTHSGGARASNSGQRPIATMADLLDPLDQWVTKGRPPADAITQVVREAAAPHALVASRPMCRYPAYPHYVAGDPAHQSSYACRAATP